MRKAVVCFFSVSLFFMFLLPGKTEAQKTKKSKEAISNTPQVSDREYWTTLLFKISYPVVHALSVDSLKATMPLETGKDYYLKADKVSHLEAVGRTAIGIAPWLSLPDDDSKEGKMRIQLRTELLKGLANAVDPSKADFLNFQKEQQPLVDAAFLAQAFLRAPSQLWTPLDTETKQRYIQTFKSLRDRKPGYNNWLLFAAMTETFLLYIGESYDPMRIDFAIKKTNEWYVGDGWYSDGEHFAMDYYNSFVIHPMLTDIMKVLSSKKLVSTDAYEKSMKLMTRYAEFQERSISPEGTYPVYGRSIAYRIGAFQVLAQASLNERLPEVVSGAQVRSALTKVMKNQFEATGTFDSKGWLQLGFAGHQPEAVDQYISTGSLYLCTVGFLPLGLPETNPFWSAPSAEWTSKKAWSGQPFKRDYKVDY